ncbi:MAG: hypothetical protein R2739_05395 [Chitinophagales bacterium]
MKKFYKVILTSCFYLSFCAGFAESGYYQKIDLDLNTSCTCKDKTTRTYELAKALQPEDFSKYNFYAYTFQFPENINGVSKLFKAFENDLSVHKISMIEWSSFMLLVDDTFDKNSFEIAANKIFKTITPISYSEFLNKKVRDKTLLSEYLNLADKQQNIIKTNK